MLLRRQGGANDEIGVQHHKECRRAQGRGERSTKTMTAKQWHAGKMSADAAMAAGVTRGTIRYRHIPGQWRPRRVGQKLTWVMSCLFWCIA